MKGTDLVTEEQNRDRWVPSTCWMCYAGCSIRAHVVDGTLVKIEGNPESSVGEGRLCAKGVAGIMMHYDPNRVNVPLKRTNPEKGIGIDPKWVEITWDEALDIIVERLREVLETNPMSLFIQGTTTCVKTFIAGAFAFGGAFGTDTIWVAGGGVHCGHGAHLLGGLMHASWSLVPDFDLCNYALYFGCSKGHGAGHVANANAQKAADARARGMKLTVVDPMCNFASAKATEWVPIRVGTDGALALAMANVLVNELGIYDRRYLKLHTNGPYLVKPDGFYLRDAATNKPMVWDTAASVAQVFDDPTVKDFSIEGSYSADGCHCLPAFQVLKDHLKKFTPEWASKITTVREATIRRLAKEFGENARVGSTIVLEGKELPSRPVAAIFFRGAQGHKNSTWNSVAIDLLNHLVGAADVPGGALGFNPVCFGHPETGRPHYVPSPCPDGLMISGTWLTPHKPYPPDRPSAPKHPGLKELFPFAIISPLVGSADRHEWRRKFGVETKPRVMINFGANALMSVANKDVIVDMLKELEFIVSFDIYLNEMTDFADIVLPDTSYLERLEANSNHPFIFNHPAGMGEWSWAIGQPVLEPAGQRRSFPSVMYEIGDRLGLRAPMNGVYNILFGIADPYKLLPDVKYEYEGICDRILRSNFGPGRGLEWFGEHGLIKWPKKVEEVYWRPFVPVRVPIYFEMFKATGERIMEIARAFGVENDLNPMCYQAVPDWYPCPSHLVKDHVYDLWAFYYRDVLHTNSLTMENPWLDEASLMNPYTYNITINSEVGRKKGLRDGDAVWMESNYGRKVKGKVKLSEGIHPEGLGIAALCGHWSDNQPIAKGKGVFFNELLEIDYEHMDPAVLNLDLCVKVKVYKA